MKSLLLSCKNFESTIKKLASRPADIIPEPINKKFYKTQKAIVVLLTVEDKDEQEDLVPKLVKEIEIFSNDTNIKTIVLFPFGHLSNKLADSKKTVSFLDELEKALKSFEVIRVHFGSHKSLLLDIYGHKGNVRFREF